MTRLRTVGVLLACVALGLSAPTASAKPVLPKAPVPPTLVTERGPDPRVRAGRWRRRHGSATTTRCTCGGFSQARLGGRQRQRRLHAHALAARARRYAGAVDELRRRQLHLHARPHGLAEPPRACRLRPLLHARTAWGSWLGGVAGDGSTLVFGTMNQTCDVSGTAAGSTSRGPSSAYAGTASVAGCRRPSCSRRRVDASRSSRRRRRASSPTSGRREPPSTRRCRSMTQAVISSRASSSTARPARSRLPGRGSPSCSSSSTGAGRSRSATRARARTGRSAGPAPRGGCRSRHAGRRR